MVMGVDATLQWSTAAKMADKGTKDQQRAKGEQGLRGGTKGLTARRERYYPKGLKGEEIHPFLGCRGQPRRSGARPVNRSNALTPRNPA